MDYRMIGAGAVLVATLAGCAKNNPHPGDASATNFEKSKDPPITARTHLAAGQVAESQGRLPAAVSQYKEALRLDPKCVDAMYHLGVVYAQLKQFRDSITTWKQYIEATGGSAESYSNLAFGQELAGDPAAAEASYLKGIARDPRSEPCRINYGLMLARRGRANEALLQLQVVLPAGQAHYNLAAVYETLNRKPEARTEYQRALELDPQLEDAKTKLAALGE